MESNPATDASVVQFMLVSPDGKLCPIRESTEPVGNWHVIAIRIARNWTSWYRNQLLDYTIGADSVDDFTMTLFLRNKVNGGPWSMQKVRVRKPKPDDIYGIV